MKAFVLNKSLEAAARVLADRHEFCLTSKQYDALVAALDAPPKARPRLQELFEIPSVSEPPSAASKRNSSVFGVTKR